MPTDRHRARIAILALAVLLAAASTRAQDANYWDNQYGTKAELLGGLVVGSPSDMSATYYNPGWIPLGVDASLLVTTQALQYSALDIKSAVGDGLDASYDSFGGSPRFLAGRFNAKRTEGWQLAWSYVEKMRFKFEASGSAIDPGPIPTTDDETWRMAEALRATKTSETWYGFTMARQLGDRSALGITPYVAYRSQVQRIQGYVRKIDGTTTDQSLFLVEEFRFNHTRLLAKIGMAWDYEPVTFGLTLTTPGIGLMGSGEVFSASSATGFDYNEDGTEDPFAQGSSQKDLKSDWNSPMSLAAGLAWKGDHWGLHFTAEYFGGVDQEGVIDPVPYTSQTTGEPVGWNTAIDQKPVCNFGLGADFRFSPRFALYLAGRTDFSSIEQNPGSDILMSTWDLWHITTGASFQFLGVGFTTGLQYSFGNGVTERRLDFTETDSSYIEEFHRTADVRYRRLKLVVGFDLALLGMTK